MIGGEAISIEGGAVSISNTIITSYSVGILNGSGTVTEDYNLFFFNTEDRTNVPTGTNSLNANPLFVDTSFGVNDYALNAGSLELSNLVYFFSLIAIGLFTGTVAIEVRRWK